MEVKMTPLEAYLDKNTNEQDKILIEKYMMKLIWNEKQNNYTHIIYMEVDVDSNSTIDQQIESQDNNMLSQETFNNDNQGNNMLD